MSLQAEDKDTRSSHVYGTLRTQRRPLSSQPKFTAQLYARVVQTCTLLSKVCLAGKTTLVNEMVRKLSKSRVLLTKISCGKYDGDALISQYASELGLETVGVSKAAILKSIEQRLFKSIANHAWPVLILDEAQGLSSDALEQVRMLTNYQVDDSPMLQIFLVGQPELRDQVLLPEMEQLHQRIIATSHLEPLTLQESLHYWNHRLQVAGWQGDPKLADDIIGPVYKASLGIPRWINLIGSRLLLRGMVEDKHELGVEDLKHVIEDLLGESLLPSDVRREALKLVATGSR